MIAMSDVLARFGPSYLRRFGARMPLAHRRALGALSSCRTAALGGHVLACDGCGVVEYVYHSCRNRFCPQCGARRTARWREARRAELLPVPYFHVVFTVPQVLRRLIRRHQRALYGVLMRAAAASLSEVAADARFVGGKLAILAVLHTWSRTLTYHPHVHCLVAAGGRRSDGTWRPVDRGYLVPGKALAKRFRGKFVAMARKAMPEIDIPSKVFRTPWVVHLDPPRRGRDAVLKYLARYVHRVALTNARLIAMDGDQVVFRYRTRDRRRWRTMRLTGHEFLRRFLQHVLPAGFHKVRYYGLWSPTYRATLRELRKTLMGDERQDDEPRPEEVDGDPTDGDDELDEDPIPHRRRCPHCGGTMRLFEVLSRLRPQARAPP